MEYSNVELSEMQKAYVECIQKIFTRSPIQEEGFAESAKVLADLGWSIPVGLTYSQITHLALPGHKPEVVSASIVDFYVKDNCAELEKLVSNTIGKDQMFEPWNDVLEECLYTFRSERYLLLPPALLSIVEGYLSCKLGMFASQAVRMIDPTKAKAETPYEHRVFATVWLSISVLVSKFYKPIKFFGPEPDELNRHWIVHGRSVSAEARTDSVKLFNVLGSLATMS